MKLYAAWVVSLLALLGSLYYGEVLGIEPCRLCCYQRIGLFPLALFLGIATLQNNLKLALYCLPLIAFGGFFALLQSVMQFVPAWQHSPFCGAHCTTPTLAPYLSFLAFLAIALLILLEKWTKNP